MTTSNLPVDGRASRPVPGTAATAPPTFGSRLDIADVVHRYTHQGQSLRQIARDIDRSYGAVHRVISLSGIPMRPRGGRPAHTPGALTG